MPRLDHAQLMRSIEGVAPLPDVFRVVRSGLPFGRIVHNVLPDKIEFSLIADHVFVISALP